MTFCNDRFPSLITLPLYPFVCRFVWCITSLPINRSIYFGHGHELHEDEANSPGRRQCTRWNQKTTQRVEDFHSFSPPPPTTCQLSERAVAALDVTAVYQSNGYAHARELKRAQNNSGGWMNVQEPRRYICLTNWDRTAKLRRNHYGKKSWKSFSRLLAPGR